MEGWQSRDSQSPRLITPDFVGRYGDVNHALAHYYDRSVKKAAAEGDIGEGELRRWIDTALITPTGTRGLAFRGASGAPGTIPGLALKCLEEAHVIRREDRGGRSRMSSRTTASSNLCRNRTRPGSPITTRQRKFARNSRSERLKILTKSSMSYSYVKQRNI